MDNTFLVSQGVTNLLQFPKVGAAAAPYNRAIVVAKGHHPESVWIVGGSRLQQPFRQLLVGGFVDDQAHGQLTAKKLLGQKHFGGFENGSDLVSAIFKSTEVLLAK